MKLAPYFAATVLSLATAALADYTLLHDFSGQSFFDGWDFTDYWDNTTNGDVQYISPVTNPNATKLAYVNPAGNVVIKVDNASFVPYDQKRESIRIQTKEYYQIGSLWIFDAVHLPYGCSVWPAFWTKGLDWPRQGEIDIMEGINLMNGNQMALHTYTGCTASGGSGQTGAPGETNCNATIGSGCTVMEKKENSFGPGFAAAGGGVWATQFDVAGVFIWFWNRADVPASITSATNSIDISSWGPPSAAYPTNTCDIASFFGPQQLVIDVTLCGDWAGVPSLYQPSCGGNGTPQGCYLNSVMNDGSPRFDNAYFEIRYVKTFGVNSSVIANDSAATNGGPPLTLTSGPTSTSKSPSSILGPSTSSTPSDDLSGGVRLEFRIVGSMILGVGVFVVLGGLVI